MVRNLPTMREARVQSLGQEDSLEEGMATHSSILTRLGGLQSMGSQSVGHDLATNTFLTLHVWMHCPIQY